MSSMPTNFITLHNEEERLRSLAIQQVQDHPDLGAHLGMTECAMNVLDMLRKHFTATDDERAISHLGIRVFNSYASAIKLAFSGYYQASVMVLRDIIETSELVEFFLLDSGHIARWRIADRETLVKKFGPSVVRKELDRAAGKGESRRKEIYQKFSHYAAHPSVDGFAMLRPKGLDSRCGPFSDITALRAVLEEMGQLASRTGFSFASSLDERSFECIVALHRFTRTSMDYAERFYGVTYTDKERAEVDRLIGK